ncbi:UNVERIFIED_CONTAM: hypothetical protein PYX00_007750 [Menopon gallinae]|uniref:Uncharacterized protein n=1 Tax=Menopon gallinae TaxID=328185 RepID=A0AAW2HK63_9NEOP
MPYLGLLLDSRWSFEDHLERQTAKMSAATLALAGTMRNLAGPSYRCRRLYATALESIALYGSPVWAGATAKNRKIQRKIAAAQKIIAIGTICGYRIIGADAVMLMACRPPIPAAAAARSSVYRETKERPTGEENVIRESRKAM